MAACAKLRCRRRLSSFLSKPLICFGGLSDIVRNKTIQRWRISGKPSFSLAVVADERINDSHLQREREASQALHSMWDNSVPTNMASSWGGKPHALYFFNHNTIGEKVLKKIRQTENRFTYCYGKTSRVRICGVKHCPALNQKKNWRSTALA